MGEEDEVFRQVEVTSPTPNGHAINWKGKTLSTSSSVDSFRSDEALRRKRLSMPMMYQMYESQYEDLRGTICGPDSPDFYPVQASESLRKALQGLYTKDQVIIDTVLHHTNFQRQKILGAYEDMYERKLSDDIEDETGGYFQEMVLALFKPAHIYDTQQLYRAITKVGNYLPIAIEIGCTRTNKQLKVIRDEYLVKYKISLDKDLVMKIEGVFGRMLSLILCKPREEHMSKAYEELISKHAEYLASTTVEEIAKDVAKFEEIFATPPWRHIHKVLEKLDDRLAATPLEKERDFEAKIRRSKSMHHDVKLLLLTIVKVARNEQLYFAEKLRNAFISDRPDHHSIIRIVVSRSETDLADVVDEYKQKYQRSIEYDINQTCSGDYERLLTSLVTGIGPYPDPHAA